MMEEEAEVIKYVTKSYTELTQLWSLYGFAAEVIDKRKKSVLKYTKEMFTEMISEEERRVEEKRSEVSGILASVTKLCKDLEMEVPPIKSNTLIQRCDELQNLEGELKKKKAEKMKEWLEYKEVEKKLRTEIGEEMSENYADFDGIPGKEDLNQLKSTIKALQKEKETRSKTYFELKPRIKTFLSELEKLPSNQIERTATDGQGDGVLPILSLEFLQKCKDIDGSLGKEVETNRNISDSLRDEINGLMRRLKDEPEAQNAPSIPKGHKPSTIALLEVEVERLRRLKMTNLSKFIDKLRTEISELCVELFKAPLLPSVPEPTEESLSEHERILESLVSYQTEHKRLLELWRKRCSVWSQWIEYEAKAEDPNRFNNRGGTLLKEEKIRKGLEKSLPKLEKEIFSLAAASPGFKIFDKSVQMLIERDWEDFNRDKEEKKNLKKQNNMTNNVTMNMTRKRPMTPSKSSSSTPAGKRGRLVPIPLTKLPTTPLKALRSSKDNLNQPPSPTYSEFTNYKQIFQSTMNEPESGTNAGYMPKSPSSKNKHLQPTPKMTTREIEDKF